MLVNTKIQQLTTTEDKHYNRLFSNNSVMTEKIGDFVKRIRNEKDLTVADVSKASNRKGESISTSYINKIENEPNVNMSYPKIQALARGLGVTETEIISRISGIRQDSKGVDKEKFENLALKFSGIPSTKKERAQALLEMLDREFDRLANEK